MRVDFDPMILFSPNKGFGGDGEFPETEEQRKARLEKLADEGRDDTKNIPWGEDASAHAAAKRMARKEESERQGWRSGQVNY